MSDYIIGIVVGLLISFIWFGVGETQERARWCDKHKDRAAYDNCMIVGVDGPDAKGNK